MPRPSFNRVFILGNLVADPQPAQTPSGTPLIKFRVAVNRIYRDSNNELREETHYFPVIAWGRTAELAQSFLQKGTMVFVEGRLQSRSWETPDGQRRQVIEIVATNLQFIARTKPKVEAGLPEDEILEGGEDIFSEEMDTFAEEFGDIEEIKDENFDF